MTRRNRAAWIAVFAAAVWAAAPAPARAASAASAGPPARQDVDPPVRATDGMVVSASALASDVGRDVLAAGGNALDAAIATGFALAVTHPSAGNIGGGGFMVIRFPDGSTTAFDFREKAPLAAHPNMFLDESGEYSREIHHDSHIAVGVPGTVAGFTQAHETYGTLDWDRLVEPAVNLAQDGFPVSSALARSLASVLPRMERYAASVEAFSKDGVPYEEGEVLRQPDLALTLGRIMREGRDGFYAGETARLLVEEMERGGGLITAEDLDRYRAVERQPLHGSYRGYDVISMPPPSSGGVALIQMLNILEGYDLGALGHNSPAYIHYFAEAMRRAYSDRARFLADTDFVEVPIDLLTSKEYAAGLRDGIDSQRASISEPADIQVAEESDQTTHYSVVDADGMAVSVTYTLERGYGSKITVAGGGFLLNNEMGDFNAKPGTTTEDGLIGTDPNLARPEQRMLSSMTPSILARDGELVAVFGSPGGRTIINTVLQMVTNIVDADMDIAEAVAAPRLHHQWLPDVLRIEDEGVDAATVQALEALGHDVSMRGTQGRVHAIAIDPDTGERLGAADPRDPDGGAVGYSATADAISLQSR